MDFIIDNLDFASIGIVRRQYVLIKLKQLNLTFNQKPLKPKNSRQFQMKS